MGITCSLPLQPQLVDVAVLPSHQPSYQLSHQLSNQLPPSCGVAGAVCADLAGAIAGTGTGTAAAAAVHAASGPFDCHVISQQLNDLSIDNSGVVQSLQQPLVWSSSAMSARLAVAQTDWALSGGSAVANSHVACLQQQPLYHLQQQQPLAVLAQPTSPTYQHECRCSSSSNQLHRDPEALAAAAWQLLPHWHSSCNRPGHGCQPSPCGQPAEQQHQAHQWQALLGTPQQPAAVVVSAAGSAHLAAGSLGGLAGTVRGCTDQHLAGCMVMHSEQQQQQQQLVLQDAHMLQLPAGATQWLSGQAQQQQAVVQPQNPVLLPVHLMQQWQPVVIENPTVQQQQQALVTLLAEQQQQQQHPVVIERPVQQQQQPLITLLAEQQQQLQQQQQQVLLDQHLSHQQQVQGSVPQAQPAYAVMLSTGHL